MQNEAKLGRTGACGQRRSSCAGRLRREVERAKRSQFGGGPTGVRGPIVQNEPNWAGRERPRRTKYAKRSQFRQPGRGLGKDGRTRKTKPIAPSRGFFRRSSAPRRGDCAKRTQFHRSAGAPEGEMCKTKPIWRADCAKRTQFWPGPWPRHPTIPVFHHSSIPSFQHSNPMPIVQNEPNFRWTRYRPHETWSLTVRLVTVAAPGYHGGVPVGISQPEMKKV